MDAALVATLNQTIYVAAKSTISNAGDITYGTPASKAARVEQEYRVVTRRDGTEQRTTHRVYLESQVDVEQRVWLPGDDQTDATLAREVLESHRLVDEDGTLSHYEIVV